MRRATIVLCLMLALPAWASAPGEPADCADWIFFEPGLTCSIVTATFPCDAGDGPADPWCNLPLAGIVLDNLGAGYRVRITDLADGIEIVRVEGEAETVIALLSDVPDTVQPCACCTATFPRCLAFNPASGALYVMADLRPSGGSGPAGWRLFKIEGLASVHDLALTFDPVAGSFGMRVPVAPEGLGQADRFDVYTGPVTRPLDLGNGTPIRCGMPGSAAGSWVPLGALPDPAPGGASWILSTVADDNVIRAGREAPAGALRGRDPARLPECL